LKACNPTIILGHRLSLTNKIDEKNKKKIHSEIQGTVAIEALKEQQTIAELAKKFEVHPNQITTWKREFLDNASAACGEEKSEEEPTLAAAILDRTSAKAHRIDLQGQSLRKKL
jgi:transposase